MEESLLLLEQSWHTSPVRLEKRRNEMKEKRFSMSKTSLWLLYRSEQERAGGLNRLMSETQLHVSDQRRCPSIRQTPFSSNKKNSPSCTCRCWFHVTTDYDIPYGNINGTKVVCLSLDYWTLHTTYIGLLHSLFKCCISFTFLFSVWCAILVSHHDDHFRSPIQLHQDKMHREVSCDKEIGVGGDRVNVIQEMMRRRWEKNGIRSRRIE